MLRFYDTPKRQLVAPSFQDEVRMYICGITPYDSAHLGHAFTFLTYDVLRMYLEHNGHSVKMVRNVTDVDEPIYKKATELGVNYRELAAAETKKFQDVMTKLGLKVPEAEPLASEYIYKIADAVHTMLKNQSAYKLENGDIYFDTSRDLEFGKNSGFSEHLLYAFSADRGGDPERKDKRNSLDFLLWKAKEADANNDPAWETIVGLGRPGWHIECSVMSKDLLGAPFDIHGGGMDLIYPHHEAEAAQGRALGYAISANHWLHVAPLLYHGEKMSKSLSNLVFAADLLEVYNSNVIRLALLSYHYRVGGEWVEQKLIDARTQLREMQNAIAARTGPDPTPFLHEFFQALENDLDTPRAVQILHNFAVLVLKNGGAHDSKSAIKTMTNLLGVTLD